MIATPNRNRARSLARSVLRWTLFFAAVLLFLVSLLVFFSAPTATLWVIAILVGEWGHYFAVGALILASLSWRRELLSIIGALLALLAAILFASPALHADLIARSLPARCNDAFGPASNETSPFRFVRLFRGVALSGTDVSTHVYALEGHKELKLDLYRARRMDGPRPLVLMIPGGSWSGGNKEQLSAINRHLARAGWAVAAMDYRHAPKFPFPAALDDVFRALDFLKAHALELQLDPSRIVLIGRSAGAQLALCAAYSGREPAIRGVVDFYGPADLILGYEKPSRRWVIDSKQTLQNYLGGSPAQKPTEYAAGSPLNFVNLTTPPTLIIHGGLDPIVWPAQSEVLAARLTSEGRPHLYLALPWATHGCEANLNGPSGQLSFYAVERFLASVLAPAP